VARDGCRHMNSAEFVLDKALRFWPRSTSVI
jgi:hypothetical protein